MLENPRPLFPNFPNSFNKWDKDGHFSVLTLSEMIEFFKLKKATYLKASSEYRMVLAALVKLSTSGLLRKVNKEKGKEKAYFILTSFGLFDVTLVK